MADYIAHLQHKLSEVDAGIEDAKTRLGDSDAGQKVKALADLNQLRLRHDDLAERIEQARAKGADTWSDLRTSFQEEADALKETLEKWLTKLG